MKKEILFLMVLLILPIVIAPPEPPDPEILDEINITQDYEPKEPIFEYLNVELIANITTNFNDIKQVLLMSDYKGDFSNYSVIYDGNSYKHTISNTFLELNQNVSWRFYVEDNESNFKEGKLMSFKVEGTNLSIYPEKPNGNNGWYLTIPIITLTYFGDTVHNILYRWDGLGTNVYITPFDGTEDTLFGGISTLHYYSNSTKLENEKEFITKVDFTIPKIFNVKPENKSLINYNNVEIYAEFNDIYQANSGINISRIFLFLNGEEKTNEATITEDNISYKTNLSDGDYNVSLFVGDIAGNELSNALWNFSIDTTPASSVQIITPIEKWYNERRIELNITGINGDFSLIKYSDDGERFLTLCRNCDSYDRLRSFDEGKNNISVMAYDYAGNYVSDFVVFYVDSKEPILSKQEPRNRKEGNGNFKIKYREDNLQNVTLYYKGENEINFNTETFYHCENGNNVECNISLNLNNYNDEDIEYCFSIFDLFGSDDTCRRPYEITIDTVSPVLIVNVPENTTYYERNIYFDIEVSEETDIKFIDFEDNRPRWKSLCRNCDSYDRRKSFSRGWHNLTIMAVDDAGNYDERFVSFEMSY